MASTREPFPKILTAGSALESHCAELLPGRCVRASALEAVRSPLGLQVLVGLRGSPWLPREASLCWEKVHSLWNQAGGAVGLEGNLWGQEDLGVEKEVAHVRSPWGLEVVGVGQEADLSSLRVGRVRNLSQLEVAREHHELRAQGEDEAQNAHGEEPVAVHSEQAVEVEVPSLARS